MKDGEMGFFDNLKEALGGDKDDEQTGSSTGPALEAVPSMTYARHVDRDAPLETADDITLVTGGKHAARD